MSQVIFLLWIICKSTPLSWWCPPESTVQEKYAQAMKAYKVDTAVAGMFKVEIHKV
jgi:hypothetical protein